MAVGTTINVYCPHRVDAIGLYFNIFNAPLWKIITTIRLQRDLGQAHAGVGRCLAWMNNGLIIFATDREITCYSKWLSDETMGEYQLYR